VTAGIVIAIHSFTTIYRADYVESVESEALMRVFCVRVCVSDSTLE